MNRKSYLLIIVAVTTALFSVGTAFAFDISLNVKCKNPTKLETVTYDLEGATETVAGSDAASYPVTLTATGLDANVHYYLGTSLGIFSFTIDESTGDVVFAPSDYLDQVGNDITILNTLTFSIRVHTLYPTSMVEVSYYLKQNNKPVLQENGIALKELPGSQSTEWVALTAVNVTPGVFHLGGAFNWYPLIVAGDGKVTLAYEDYKYNDQLSLAGNDITIQNKFSVTVPVKTAYPTGLETVFYRHGYGLSWTRIYDEDGVSMEKVVDGDVADQHPVDMVFTNVVYGTYYIWTSFNYYWLIIGADGTVTVDPSKSSSAQLTQDGNSITINNTLSFALSAWTEYPVALPTMWYKPVYKFSFTPILENGVYGKEMPGAESQTLVVLSVDNVLPGKYQLATPFSWYNFQVDENLIVSFGCPAEQIGPNQFKIPIEDTNILYINVGQANTPPQISLGENLQITSQEQETTILPATATDSDNDPLTYRWLENETGLIQEATVGPDGACTLDLSTLSPFSLGNHTLTLEVSDGKSRTTGSIILTIDNSPPHCTASGGGTYQVNTDITLSGTVSDFDGDALDFTWTEGNVLIHSETISTLTGGVPVDLLPHTILGGLMLGNHTLTLTVSDGYNDAVSKNIDIEVIDTTNPALAPVADRTMLWPPNHEMVPVTIQANASDSSGEVTITATVTSSEAVEADGDGNTVPDYTEPYIDQATGEITLQLRSERSGKGDGRIYKIKVAATDSSGNTSSADVEIIAPHDKRKKQ